jgi:hypothetical protein
MAADDEPQRVTLEALRVTRRVLLPECALPLTDLVPDQAARARLLRAPPGTRVVVVTCPDAMAKDAVLDTATEGRLEPLGPTPTVFGVDRVALRALGDTTAEVEPFVEDGWLSEPTVREIVTLAQLSGLAPRGALDALAPGSMRARDATQGRRALAVRLLDAALGLEGLRPVFEAVASLLLQQ